MKEKLIYIGIIFIVCMGLSWLLYQLWPLISWSPMAAWAASSVIVIFEKDEE